MSIESRKPALYKGNAPRERSTCIITTTNSPISCYIMRVAVGCAERILGAGAFVRLGETHLRWLQFLSKLCFLSVSSSIGDVGV
jgi:hypothetical protein